MGRRFAFDAIPFLPVAPNTTVGLEVQAAIATWTEEGASIALAAGDLTTVRLPVRKLATIRIITKDLATRTDPAAGRAIERMLTRDVGTATDAAAFDPADPNSLAYGVTAITTTGNLPLDIANLLAAVSDGVASRPYLVLGAAAARELFFSADQMFANVKLIGTGDIGGVPTITTPAPALNGYVVAVDADGVVKVDEGISIDRAESATVQMDSAPTMASADGSSPPQPIPTTVVSLT